MHFHAGGGGGGYGGRTMDSSHVGGRHTYLLCMERKEIYHVYLSHFGANVSKRVWLMKKGH